MAVMDFREGGYVFSRHKVRREFSYDSADWEDSQGQAGMAAAPMQDPLGVRLGRLTHYLGAIASVGLMVGLMTWGWQLVSRDVSGVPVIRAVEGEARTAPEEPGGALTSHTGLAVNDVAGGIEARPVDQLAIAPSATGLDDSDVAMGALGATAREPSNPSDAVLNFDGEPVVPLSDSEARAMAAAEAERVARLAAADAAVSGASIIDAPALEGPINEAVTDENGAPAQAAAITDALAQAQASVPASARPARRPRVMAAVAAPVAAAASVAADATAAPAPAPVASSAGGPLVQIGAFDSNAIAAGEWDRLANKFGGMFAGKGQVIQQHQSSGRTFWRLRVAGFGSTAEARQFCAAMKAGGTDCIALAQ